MPPENATVKEAVAAVQRIAQAAQKQPPSNLKGQEAQLLLRDTRCVLDFFAQNGEGMHAECCAPDSSLHSNG